MTSKAQPIDLYERQREAIDYRGGHLLLLAGPGTGKTETLVHRAAALINEARDAGAQQPEILMLTFARKAARQMRERVASRIVAGGRVPVCSTFHAFALHVVDRSRPRALGELGMLTPAKERLLVERVCGDAAPRLAAALGGFTEPGLRSKRFAGDLANLIGRCKQERLGPAELARAVRSLKGDGGAGQESTGEALATIAALYAQYELARAELALRDFRDLVNDAIAALQREPLRYAHVFVDELQDTDAAELRLLELLVAAGARLTAVGDPNQSIYRFRSASPAAIDDARAAFTPHEIALDQNRRCPEAIVTAANRLAEPPPAGHPLDPPEPVLSRESLTFSVVTHAGSVRWHRFADAAEEAAGIAREIRRLVGAPRADGSGPLRYRDVAVILRAPERHAERIAIALRREGMPVVRSGASAFLGDLAVDFVLTHLRALAEPLDAERLHRLLSSPVVGVPARMLRIAARRLVGRGADPDALALSQDLLPAERERVARFAAGFREIAARWRAAGARDLVREIARVHRLSEAIVAQSSEEAQRASAARLQALIDLADDVDAVVRAGAAEQLVHSARELFDLVAEDEAAPEIDGVAILSMHAAKGLEFPVAFLPAAVRGELPSPPRPDPLLDDEMQQALFHHAGLPPPPTAEEQLDEELRLFYVACTRASEQLIVTGYAQAEGAPVADSAFVARLGLGARDGEGQALPDPLPADAPLDDLTRDLALRAVAGRGGDVALAGLSAAARRIVTDAAAPAPQPPASPPYTGDAFSPRALETYLRCPRQFFFAYVARAEGDERESPRALLGTVLHEALAALHRAHPEGERLREQGWEGVYALLEPGIAAALERRRRRDPESVPPPESALCAGIVARAREYAANYARWLCARPESFAVRETEVAVAFTVTGGDGRAHPFRGRIDRVDELAGALVVRDYKTSREHPFASSFRKLADAEELPLGGVDGAVQLPLYALAIEQSRPGTRVAALDLLFLRGSKHDEGTACSRMAAIVAGESLPKGSQDLARGELERGMRRIGDLCGALRDGRAGYRPVPGNACRTCAFNRACDKAASEDGEEQSDGE